ncbi:MULTISPECIES: hypothetical protein [unclassified Wolbachia]|nr:hypothetical protein [Wolbachia endosymbiont (group A) of Cydia splendana]
MQQSHPSVKHWDDKKRSTGMTSSFFWDSSVTRWNDTSLGLS